MAGNQLQKEIIGTENKAHDGDRLRWQPDMKGSDHDCLFTFFFPFW